MITQLKHEIKQLENKERARFLAGFFKTGKGQYGEGDVFYGLTVPQCRIIAAKYKTLSLEEITQSNTMWNKNGSTIFKGSSNIFVFAVLYTV